MRCFGNALLTRSALLWALLAGPVFAQQLRLPGLEEWTLFGGKIEELAESGQLPAGAQLLRTFPTGSVLFTMKSNPQPGENPETWPVIEIGPVAVVVSQRGEALGVALVDASGYFERLDQVFRPAGEISATSSLEIQAVFTEGMLAIATNGVVRVFAFPQSGFQPHGLTVSAGDSIPWLIEALEVTPFVVGEEPPSAARVQSVAKSLLEAQARGLRRSPERGASSSDASAGEVATKETKLPVLKQSTRVEAYSAPSVRHGRTFLLREIAARNLKR